MLAPCGRLIAWFGCLLGLGLATRDLLPEKAIEAQQISSEGGSSIDIPQAAFPMLLADPRVRHELSLDESQIKQVDRWLIRLLGQYAADCPTVEPDEFATFDEAQRELWVRGLRAIASRTVREAEGQLGEILHGEQLARLCQLRTQREGLMALQRREVRDQMGLSPKQCERISRLPQFSQPHAVPPCDISTLNQKLADVLTTSQFEQWKLLNGVPFEFQPLERTDLQQRLLEMLLAFTPRTPQPSPRKPPFGAGLMTSPQRPTAGLPHS